MIDTITQKALPLLKAASYRQVRGDRQQENKVELVRRIFGAVDRAYLIRCWVIGAIFFALLIAVTKGQNSTLTIIYAINTVLFPYSKLVWDEAKGFVLGGTVLFLPALMLLIFKLFVNVLLWGFSIFVAPLGILWVWYRSR